MSITDWGRQLAADLTNAESSTRDWTARDFGLFTANPVRTALARLATQSLADKAALADLQASYDRHGNFLGFRYYDSGTGPLVAKTSNGLPSS